MMILTAPKQWQFFGLNVTGHPESVPFPLPAADTDGAAPALTAELLGLSPFSHLLS